MKEPKFDPKQARIHDHKLISRIPPPIGKTTIEHLVLLSRIHNSIFHINISLKLKLLNWYGPSGDFSLLSFNVYSDHMSKHCNSRRLKGGVHHRAVDAAWVLSYNSGGW